MKQVYFTDCVELVGEACKPYIGSKKYVSTGAVNIDHINEADIEVFSYDEKPSRANLVAKPGDILFAKMMGTNKTLQIDRVTSEYIFSTGFFAARAKNELLTDRCLYHLLTSKTFHSQKDRNCSGATQKAITNAGLSKIKINLPDISFQSRLAGQLDTLTTLIHLYTAQLNKLDSLIYARFVEMFGDLTTDETKYPRVPLGSVAEVGSSKRIFEKEYVNQGVPFYRTKEIVELSKGHSISTELFISQERFHELKKFGVPQKGDLLISAVGTIGVIWIVDRKTEFYFKDGNLLRVSDFGGFDPLYLKELLEVLIAKYKGKVSAGSAYAALTIAELKKMMICDAPANMQKQFASFAAQIEKAKAAVQRALDKAQLLFDSLIQKYFG